jgi:thiol-disulfide isomerase/thioredoxin
MIRGAASPRRPRYNPGMKTLLLGSAVLAAAALPLAAQIDEHAEHQNNAELYLGPWTAWLDSPGGELRFELDFSRDPGEPLRAWLVNGPERVEIPSVRVQGPALELEIEHYDSVIVATVDDDGQHLEGVWSKVRGRERFVTLDFHARFGIERSLPNPANMPPDWTGRWAVDFASDDLPAVGLFDQDRTRLVATFMTSTGDYRYLAGDVSIDGSFEVSVFDGAHAFLFRARPTADGGLEGDFYSGDSWHDTWTARRDESARLADEFAQTTWRSQASLAELVLPDLDGRPRSLADPEFAGRAILIQLFGSWCPNCHDETAYLVDVDRRFRERGLVILGLAFELTGDFARDANQVRAFQQRWDVRYPLFVAGPADKRAASLAFPAIDELRSYPTTIFMHGDGRVRSVHSGFKGPATGKEHKALRREFEALIEELLSAPPATDLRLFELLTSGPWHPTASDEPELAFTRADDGALRVAAGPGDAAAPVRLFGNGVWLGGRALRVDRTARALLDPLDPGTRWSLSADAPTPLLRQKGYGTERLALALDDVDSLVRREAVFALVRARI